MKKKIIFLDVDGTLVTIRNHEQYIPESAVHAIRTARANGHLVYLCTGRGMAEIDEFLTGIGLDGIIGAAGGFIMEDDRIILHHRMQAEDVEKIQQHFDECHAGYYLESNSGLYANPLMKQMISEAFPGQFADMMKPLDQADLNDINKISFMGPAGLYDDIHDLFSEHYSVVRASWIDEAFDAGEIGIPNVSKGTAIAYLLKHLDMSVKDTFAFGDSMNDIEMFRAVNTSIVMGGSMHGVHKYADFITKTPEQDGIEYAMKHYGLI